MVTTSGVQPGSEVRSANGRGILIIATNFPPDRRAGTHRLLRFTRDLDALGWRVSVLTMDPGSYRPGTPIDERLLQQVPSSVRITRTAVPGRGRPGRGGPVPGGKDGQGADGGAARLAPLKRRGWLETRVRRFWHDLTSTPDQDLAWALSAVPAGTRLVREERLDVILSSAPPFTTHVVAGEVARRTGVPWVADFRDPWSRAPWALEFRNEGWTGRVHRTLERRTITRARHVILNTPPMRDDFVEHYPSLASKFLAIPNGFDTGALDRSVKAVERTAPPGTLVVCHTGNLYQARDPRPLFRALAALVRDGIVPRDAFRLQLVGGAGREFDAVGEVDRLGLRGIVEFLPPVSHGESLGYLRAADVLLVVQPDTRVQVPVKLYEYLWARKPILALASDGAVADLVLGGHVGRVVPADDEGAIADALRDLQARRETLASDYVASASFLQQLEGSVLTRRLHDLLMEATA